jgi:hypothetical protein
LSVEKFVSAVGAVGSALNSSEPRGMWIAPAPVAATVGAVAHVGRI